MQKIDRYSIAIAEKQSIYPSKLVIYNDILKWDNIRECEVKGAKIVRSNKIERAFHNFKLSQASRQKIIKKINWLFHNAKSKSIRTYSGKEIYNFKVNFMTFTLPSEQIHPTSVINKECFERLLNELRNRAKMNNYVWRLEFQKNGNVHYHLVTDTYIDYFFALKIWNRIINYLGYVDRFAEKMKNVTFAEYCSTSKEKDFDKLKKRYLKGRAENWKNPNSVDCKSANSQNNISFYISKYFGKKSDHKTDCNNLDNEENSFGLRLWFASRSLSKLDAIKDFVESAEIHFANLVMSASTTKKIVYDYCTVFYYNFKDLGRYAKSCLGALFRDYVKEVGYISA